MAKRESKTFIYAPRIQVLIATTGHGVLDVSDDIVNFQLRRVMNAASQFGCVLNNRNQKYTGVLGRMDRITVFLTKTEKMQAFSGYLDSVPGLSLYTNTCEIKATCTLKRLINTWWDPGLPDSQKILNQTNWSGPDSQDPYNKDADSGLGQMLGSVLTEVAGWDAGDIYIQNIPEGFLKLGLEIAAKEENKDQIEILKRLLGVSTSGASALTGTGTQSAGTVPVLSINIGDYQENFESEDFYAKFTGPYPPGDDPVERWRPLALLALQQVGEDADNIDAMMHRIRIESTGDPNAVNLWDRNFQNGYPSRGILQCIPDTFNAWAVAPYNNHINSPLGSMLASLRYAKATYGTVKKAYLKSGGY